MSFDPQQRIFVAGHRGMVGSALVRRLRALNAAHLILRSRSELDLEDDAAVGAFFRETRPEVVIVAAARVGGIHANQSFPASFLRENLAIALNTIHAAFGHGARRLLFLGSSCIYPRLPNRSPRTAF